MKNKIPLLITASLLGLLALSGIQGYLINNTYKLKKGTFLDQVTGRYAGVEDYSESLDSVEAIWFNELKQLIIQHHEGTLSGDSVIPEARSFARSLDDSYAAAYRNYMPDAAEDADFKFQKRLASLVVFNPLGIDTLLADLPGNSVLLVGEEFKEGLWHRIGRSTSQTSVSLDDDYKPGDEIEVIRYVVVTDNLVNTGSWHSKILAEMKGLLLASVLIFVLVFGLLYYSIKNLITQKKIAEVKTDFVNNITHEFKTPLATLSIATKLLAEETIPARSREVVSVIERQNARLQKLTDQVVNNALSYREIELKKEWVIAETYLSTLLDDFLLTSDATDFTLERDISLGTRKIELDRFYMTSALLNILGNAVKYNQPPVTILVSAAMAEDLVLRIADNGRGIPAAHLPHLFDKFYRVGNREVHDVKGLGLGLYFANQVVRAHGGNLSVESTEGQGCCFTIRLPLHQ